MTLILLRKYVARLLFPAPLSIELILLGLILLWLTKKQKAGKVLVSAGIILLMFVSNSEFGNLLLRPLEHRYPPLLAAEEPAGKEMVSRAGLIVVLAGGFAVDPRVPVASQIGQDTLGRLAEGIRLYREFPGRKLLLSGGAGLEPVPVAELMRETAVSLGVPPEDVLLEAESRTTREQAQRIRSIVGDAPFILVTAASHMPRAMRMFERSGMSPVPAPANFLARSHQRVGPDEVFPNSGGLIKSERAVYEYLGLLWARLAGEI